MVIKKIIEEEGNLMFIDTHCHMTMLEGETADVVAKAAAKGTTAIISVGTTLEDSLASVAIAKSCTGGDVWTTVGIHPCDCSENWQDDLKKIEQLCENKKENKIVGIGETGIDFYHKPFDEKLQTDSFIAHIECAIAHDLPLVVHIRESADAVLSVLERYKGSATGVAHCFFQKLDVAKTLIDWGFYLGIGGPLTYPKNEWLRELIAEIDLQHIVLETDAPFLPPQPFRGKKNHPAYLSYIAEQIAQIKGITIEEVGKVTSANARELFGL